MHHLTHSPEAIRQDLARRQQQFARAQRSGGAPTTIRAGIAVLGVLIGFAAATDHAAAAKAETRVVSDPQGGAADEYSNESSVSANGRFVAFTSFATNLSEDDGDGVRDVFVRDMREETIALVSRANGPDGEGGQADSYAPSISADGRYVAFTSDFNDFTDEDGPGLDVFVRDLRDGETTFVSRASGPTGAGGDSDSHSPAISANGRYVAFESNADNLGSVSSAYANVFVRDLKRQRTTLASRASGRRGASGDRSSVEPSISGGGRFVAFASAAQNLSGKDSDFSDDVFVRDLESNETELVSRRGRRGPGGDANSFAPAISANGRVVAFASGADNLDPAGDDPFDDIFVRDLGTSSTDLVSRRSGADGAKAIGNSFQPSISARGTHVAYISDGDNLSRDDNDAWDNVYVRSLESNRNMLASRVTGSAGAGADDHSEAPSISADGLFVTFTSAAENLSDDDAQSVLDVFRRDLRERGTTG